MSEAYFVDLDRVKQLTLAKLQIEPTLNQRGNKRLLLLAAAVILLAATLLGASKLFDWKVMVGTSDEIRQGYYGDAILVGDGYAAMSPEMGTGNADKGETILFSHDTPNSSPVAGQLLLFGSVSDSGDTWTGTAGVRADDSTDFTRLKQLAQGAERAIGLPWLLDDGYQITKSCTRFYTTKSQLRKAELQYSSFTEWNAEQLFTLPKGYEKNISSMFIRLEGTNGQDLAFSAFLSTNNLEVYGGSGKAVIERLEIPGFERRLLKKRFNEGNRHESKRKLAIMSVFLYNVCKAVIACYEKTSSSR